ncbi:zinc transporter ZIP1 [Paroedura picta]|uniref:zinc transporter ZIP1 n=1 Tax=Paroedura picta TaxID=143630 RepID=UPI0040572D49
MEELGSKPLSGAMAEQGGPEPELLVWQPYTRLAAVRSPVGLEVKLGSLVLLLLVTLVCGFLPLWVFRRPGSATSSSATRKRAISLVSCFAGGIFLATCLLDLIPDYLSSINEALANLGITLLFPLQEFILAMGFFLVLVMEQIVLAYKDPSGTLEETQALLGSPPQNAAVQERGWPDGPLPRQLPRDGPLRERPHVHVDFNAHSAIRCFVLLLGLSLHSIFEGLAVGLQEGSAQALEICLALLIHKGAIAFSLSFKLLQSRLRVRAVAGCLILFSIMSPLGIGLGVALTESPVAVLHGLSRSVLEGLAAGTFVYITFLEILPHELSSSEQRILKVIVLLAGFALVTSILFIKI